MTNNAVQESLSSRMIALRRSKKLSQEAFADEIGISRTQIWRIERGKSVPKMKTLKKVEAVCGLVPNSLCKLLEDTVDTCETLDSARIDTSRIFTLMENELQKKNLTSSELYTVYKAAIAFADSLTGT